jgi:Zn-dependent peptidase ImmA (M78 family)
MSTSYIEKVLNGPSELLLEDLDMVCLAIDINLFWLTSSDYSYSKTIFRNLGRNLKAKEIAFEIENAFLTILDFLPKPRKVGIRCPKFNDRAYTVILAEVLGYVNKFQEKYGKDVLQVIQELNIPVFASNLGGNFDGFILGAADKFAITLDETRPHGRTKFTLFHELAHYLFHQDQEFNVDILEESKPYGQEISQEDVVEFVANKFAQYSIVPFNIAEELWSEASWKWERLNILRMQGIINSTGASIDVLAYCLNDTYRFHGQPNIFRPLYTYLKDNLRTSQDSDWKSQLFDKQRTKLDSLLKANEDEFSTDVLDGLRGILNIPDYLQAMNE